MYIFTRSLFALFVLSLSAPAKAQEVSIPAFDELQTAIRETIDETFDDPDVPTLEDDWILERTFEAYEVKRCQTDSGDQVSLLQLDADAQGGRNYAVTERGSVKLESHIAWRRINRDTIRITVDVRIGTENEWEAWTFISPVRDDFRPQDAVEHIVMRLFDCDPQ